MSAYYEDLKQLARELREQHAITTKTLNLTAVKKIYRAEGIAIDIWKLSPRIRAVYMCDENDPSVLINETLPKEPRLFAMVHELKHHFRDRAILECGQIPCGAYNENREIEVGAEVFAAEFIFPEAEFITVAQQLNLFSKAPVTPEDVVRLKRTADAPVSYQFLRKRLEFFKIVPKGQFAKVKFTVLEEQMFGVPIYKQDWFRQRRAARSNRAS
ncbi:MAG: ImmA/IrrE family metallo-endopeptidase [Acidobacteriota bacterium]|nr:ImmA/IrrE family metallo-endopeptidase [Acidobacteriota bacterium]